jgi:hypothetical protein
MLGAGASLVHAGLTAANAGHGSVAAGHGLTDLSGLEGLVNNSGLHDPLSGHHHHHSAAAHHHPYHHQSPNAHLTFAAAAAQHPHVPPHHHHHHHHHLQQIYHSPNQPLPPHRPFTPPGALTSHQLHSAVTNNSALVDASSTTAAITTTNNNGESYSPNSTTHMPTSTVKIKTGRKGNYSSILIFFRSSTCHPSKNKQGDAN